ncbi:hypothetical protein ACFQL1_03690 [Halomicroarcula sp. GCM10025709]|uniref:hypothetical protein n=1 Tax=Halomicroarcula sp. GCM10025709 TaxID=3252669 RepID=UPI00360F3490
MSSIEFSQARQAGSEAEHSARTRLTTALFGDRIGLTIFLASLCLFVLGWRTAIFITDTYTLANGLHAVSQGALGYTEPAYGGSLDTPGATASDGRTIARNYGAIVLSLPFLALIEGVGAVASLRIGIAALWALLALGAVAQGVHCSTVRVSSSAAASSSSVCSA